MMKTEEKDSKTVVSRSMRIFTQSAKNTKGTPYYVNRNEAADAASDIAGDVKKPRLKDIPKNDSSIKYEKTFWSVLLFCCKYRKKNDVFRD